MTTPANHNPAERLREIATNLSSGVLVLQLRAISTDIEAREKHLQNELVNLAVAHGQKYREWLEQRAALLNALEHALGCPHYLPYRVGPVTCPQCEAARWLLKEEARDAR